MALMAAKDKLGIPRSLILDDISRTLVNVDFEAHMRHSGFFFTSVYTNDVTNTNEKTALAFNTPMASPAGVAPKLIHMVVRAQVTDITTFQFLEDPSIDEAEATAALTPLNSDRSSALVSDLADVTPVKATGGVLEWTGAGEELDEFSIGLDVYLVAALEATADAAGKIWVDLGNGLAATMVTNATAAIDGAQATSANAPATVEATDGTGDTIDIIADNFGSNGNLAVTVIVGANMAAGVSLTGGVGGLVGLDGEYPGLANRISAYEEAEASTANITTTLPLIDEVIFGGAGVPTWDSKNGLPWASKVLILKPGYQYCALLNSDTVNDNSHRIILEWFEYTHKTPASDH